MYAVNPKVTVHIRLIKSVRPHIPPLQLIILQFCDKFAAFGLTKSFTHLFITQLGVS